MIGRRRLCAALLGLGALGWGALGRGGPARAAQGAPRIASLDYALTETMLALGAVPIAMPDGQDWDTWVVEPPLPPTVENLGSDQQINFELLASLKPDLILTTPYLDDIRPTLERIAPCWRLAIYDEGPDSKLVRAARVTRQIAGLLGDPARGEALVAAVDARLAADRAALAGRGTGPLLFASLIDARHVRVYGAGSLWGDVLDRLGLANAWRDPPNYWGFATVGIEALATPAADALVVFAPLPADALPTLADSPLWRSLPFVRRGAVWELPPVLMFGALPAARRFSTLLTARLLRADAHG